MTFNLYFLTRTLAAALTSALLFAMTAQAHNMHDKSKYGGVVAESAAFQAELVVKQTTVTIYLSDHGKEVSTQGASGKLTILSEGKTLTATLLPSTGNQLQATLPAALKTGKFVAQITLPKKSAVSVRFELK